MVRRGLALLEVEIEPNKASRICKSHGKGERQYPPGRAGREIIPGVYKFPKQAETIRDQNQEGAVLGGQEFFHVNTRASILAALPLFLAPASVANVDEVVREVIECDRCAVALNFPSEGIRRPSVSDGYSSEPNP